ncbi:MAG: hypothetical protein P4L35_11770 [Ignavibacteriaceae bacterium]|nr:hypothetical protein [Ignavibacteriaceae bacterium]
MKRNNKTLIVLIITFVIITAIGSIYSLFIQKQQIQDSVTKLDHLRLNYSDLSKISSQLKNAQEKATAVDSFLFSGRFTIPRNISQSRFYNFIDTWSGDHSIYTFTNTEYQNKGVENGFNYYSYKVSGCGGFDEVYGLIYAIEHSKDLMKIQTAELVTNTIVDSKGVPHYIVKFNLMVKEYFSQSDQYAAIVYTENNLRTGGLYNAFFPLVRNEIRPNTEHLPDIQGASLISLVPQGAFIMDASGNTTLMEKGDPVYLGNLMDIDYDHESVTFVLNKGGIVEFETLKLGQLNKKEGNKK